jgi:hypothetical protein
VQQFLDGPFPPLGGIPVVTDVARIQELARGGPGDPVMPGLYPRPRVKLARLALAAGAHCYPISPGEDPRHLGYS